MKQFLIKNQNQVTARLDQASRDIRTALEKGVDAVVLTLTRESRSAAMNRKFHAMIRDISKTVEIETKHSPEIWKALLVDKFENELKLQRIALSKPSRVIMSLDSERIISIRASTTDFDKQTGSNFIEFLYWFGQEYGAAFSDESLSYYEEIARSV